MSLPLIKPVRMVLTNLWWCFYCHFSSVGCGTKERPRVSRGCQPARRPNRQETDRIGLPRAFASGRRQTSRRARGRLPSTGAGPALQTPKFLLSCCVRTWSFLKVQGRGGGLWQSPPDTHTASAFDREGKSIHSDLVSTSEGFHGFHKVGHALGMTTEVFRFHLFLDTSKRLRTFCLNSHTPSRLLSNF